MSVLSIKNSNRNSIQNDDLDIEPKKLSLVNNTMNGSAAQAQGTHNNHDTNFVPNYYHTPRRAKNSPVLPIGRAHNGLIPYP